MTLDIPSTEQIKQRNETNFEAEFGVNLPLNKRAFLRVLGVVLSTQETSLYRLGIDRAQAVFAITAEEEDLDRVGSEYGVTRKAAASCVVTVDATGTNGTVIPATANFIAALNGLRYTPDSSSTISGGTASFQLTCQEAGDIGTLEVGNTLTIESPISGLDSEVTVSSVDTVGADEETDTDYRVRILDVIRTQGGGGNSADYRTWSQEVAGVARAYPYAGRSSETPTPSSPPDRTVFVEASSGDGTAGSTLLDQVRDRITTDPDTGKTRQPLGMTDETLFVESVTLRPFYFQVRDLVVDAELETDAKADVLQALTDYCNNIRPFISGLDIKSSKNDTITKVSASEIVQVALEPYGASASEVQFGLSSGVYTSDTYTLDLGEIGSFGEVAYV